MIHIAQLKLNALFYAVVTDWNDTLAPDFRKGVNYFVPCYFQAFPPYQVQHLPTDTCPVARYTSADQPLLEIRPDGKKKMNLFYCEKYVIQAVGVFV